MADGQVEGQQQNGSDVTQAPTETEEEGPSLTISINNVVSSFGTRCHLNLKKIAMEGTNVEYHRQHGVICLLQIPYNFFYIKVMSTLMRLHWREYTWNTIYTISLWFSWFTCR